jgi:hypothetical protein
VWTIAPPAAHRTQADGIVVVDSPLFARELLQLAGGYRLGAIFIYFSIE